VFFCEKLSSCSGSGGDIRMFMILKCCFVSILVGWLILDMLVFIFMDGVECSAIESFVSVGEGDDGEGAS